MSLGNVPKRNGGRENSSIAANLREHDEMTLALQAAGVPRAVASRLAYNEITKRPARSARRRHNA